MVGGAPVAKSQRNGVWAFSEGFEHAAVARPDGSVDVFDIAAGARVIERFASSPSSGGRPSTLAVSSKRSRSSLSVATGSSGGDVSIAGKIATVLSGGSVAAIEFCSSGFLACGGGDKEVTRIDPDSGKVVYRCSIAREHRNALSSLAISAGGKRAAVCSQNISLFDIVTGKIVRSFSGHASPVTASCFFASDSRLVTGSTDDQFLYIWDATEDEGDSAKTGSHLSSAKKQKRRRKSSRHHPLHTLIAPEQGVRSIAVTESEEESFSICAVLKSGVIAVWPHWTLDCNSASTKARGTINPLAKDTASGVPAVHGAGFRKQDTLSVVYGNTLKPQVHSVELAKISGEVYLPKPCSESLLISSNGPLRADQVPGLGKSAVDVTRAEAEAPEAITALETGSTRVRNGDVIPRRKREKRKSARAEKIESGTDDEGEAESSTDSGTGAQSGAEEDKSDEPTLRERLSAIGVSNEDSAEGAPARFPKSQLKEKLDSRAEVILQAVKSRDDRLLNSVIYQRHPVEVIQTTVRQLPAHMASDNLLTILSMKLRREPRHIIDIVPWIQNILFEHAGSLINRPKSAALCNLMDTVTKRNQTLDALNRLEGRLELVAAQARRASSLMKTNLNNAKPQVEYIERVKKVNENEDDMRVSEDEEESDEEGESEEDGDCSDEGDTGVNISGEEGSDESEEDKDDDRMEVDNVGRKAQPLNAKLVMNGHALPRNGSHSDY